MVLRSIVRHSVAATASLVLASCSTGASSGGGQGNTGGTAAAGAQGAFVPSNLGGTGAGAGSGGQGTGTGGALGTGASSATGGAMAAGTGGTPGAGGTPGDAGRPGTAGTGSVADAGVTPDAGGSTSPGGGAPALGTVEDSGADCHVPSLPAASQLTPYAKHQDPFTMLDGSRITQKAQWRCRRAEIEAQVERYETGPKPAVEPGGVSAQLSGNSLAITVSSGGKSVSFSVSINRPAGAGSDPIPLVIEYSFSTLDETVFSQNGVATLIYDNDSMAAEAGGGSRGTGAFYDLYGHDHPAGDLAAWAWGVSRIIDALEKTPEAHIDPKRIAVTGCSRYGKGALLAGALDERIVLTIPQESGAGGSASWRVSEAQSAMGENVQTLSNAANEQPWFRADFGQSFGGSNVPKLPFDHHMVMGLVAPRALLVIDNPIDWLGIDSTFTAGSIAHAIWEAFGLTDHMGYWQSDAHTHCQFPSQQRAILEAYVKKFLVGTGTDDTNMLRAENANADLASWMDWTPPSLQ